MTLTYTITYLRPPSQRSSQLGTKHDFFIKLTIINFKACFQNNFFTNNPPPPPKNNNKYNNNTYTESYYFATPKAQGTSNKDVLYYLHNGTSNPNIS